jgi:hypothetical protein
MLKTLEKRVGKISLLAILATMLVVTLTVPALAAVTFDPAIGTGFVGKGDVQNSFQWNNADAQKNAQSISFTYKLVDTYEVTTQWYTTTGGKTPKTITHTVNHEKDTTMNANVQYDARTHKQVDGFNLKGFGAYTETGFIPVVGDIWNPNSGTEDAGKPIIDVQLISSTGGLYVNFGTQSVMIWSPQTPVV